MNMIYPLLVAWGAVEVVLFGGIVFGWASLVFIYKQEGIFTNYCSPQNSSTALIINTHLLNSSLTDKGSLELYNVSNSVSSVDDFFACNAQDKLFNLIYVLAVVINGIASFPNGIIWDKYGTRVMRIIGAATFVPGIIMAACITNTSSLLLFPALILIAYGGYVVLLTNFQLGNLLPRRRSMIISLYCGAYDSSAFMLVLIKWAYSAGMTAKYSFTVLLGLYVMFLTSTFWFMPKTKIPFPLPKGYKLNLTPCEKKCENLDRNDQKLDKLKEEIEASDVKEMISQESGNLATEDKELVIVKQVQNIEAQNATFAAEALSLLFIWDTIWLTCMRLQSWSFIGRLNPALERLSGGDQSVVSHYTSVYACMQFFGIFLAPLSGRLMDRKKNREVDPRLKRIEMIEVCIASFIIDTTFGLLLAIATTIPILEVQYVSFVFHVVHRALLYGPNSAFIAQTFSSQNFGKLFGLVMTVSAGVSLIQFPLFLLVQGPLEGDPLIFNILIIILMIVSFGHPIYLKIWCNKEKRLYVRSKNPHI